VFRSSSLLATLAATAALLAVPAFAQGKDKYPPAYYEAGYDDEIVIVAPQRPDERTASGARIETVTASRVLSIADLDLRYDDHVDELRRRIRTAAIAACRDAERASDGVMLTRTTECVRDAERGATLQADAMIYAARGLG
jgi:UrcA family protein